MEFLYLLIALAVVALAVYVAVFVTREFASIAESKGYDYRRYWHVAFWLGLVGYLIILGLPDLNSRNAQKLVASRLSELNETLKAAEQSRSGSSSGFGTIDLPEL